MSFFNEECLTAIGSWMTGQRVIVLQLSMAWAGVHRDISQTGGEISWGDGVDQRRSSVSLSTRAGCLTEAWDKRERKGLCFQLGHCVWSLAYLSPSLALVIPSQPSTKGRVTLRIQHVKLAIVLIFQIWWLKDRLNWSFLDNVWAYHSSW